MQYFFYYLAAGVFTFLIFLWILKKDPLGPTAWPNLIDFLIVLTIWPVIICGLIFVFFINLVYGPLNKELKK